MAKGFNHERLTRRDRTRFTPSWRSQPPTQAQLDYIQDLGIRKGRPVSPARLPKTKQGASDLIDRLLLLTDVNTEQMPERVVQPVIEQKPTDRQEMGVELREHFRQLTPMTVNSMVQLFCSLDELGTALTLDEVMRDEHAPEDHDELVLFILRRFLENFGGITVDDQLAA